MMEICIQTAHI